MKSIPFLSVFVTLLSCTWLCGADSKQQVNFARQVLPILSNKCFVCHGPDTQDDSQLRLDSFAAASKDLGGYHAIDPTDPNESELLVRIRSEDDPMPPADAEKQLTANEKQILERWIAQGGTYAKHWAFVPPQKQLSQPQDDVEGANPIDIFIHSRLREQGLSPAPEADVSTLARRAALVLTGLPPESDWLRQFRQDSGPRAFERYVDRLLADLRFGEQQARHWLDAVRYGDTHGLHLDNVRQIHPYRDWVVSALNRNLPLDEFITWQLAGDLLPDPTIEQRVATGYVRMNPTSGEGGAIQEEYQAKNNFDRTENLGEIFLGLTLTCARCHTHKYDPIQQTEYYRLMSFFNSTGEPALDGNKALYGPTIEAPDDYSQWTRWFPLVRLRTLILQQAEADLASKRSQFQIQDKLWQQWRTSSADRKLRMLADPASPLAQSESHLAARELVAGIDESRKAFAATLVAKDLAQPRATHVLDRGEYNRPVGEPVTSGVPAILGELPADAPTNRLGLARWLTSREHPLVARVLVNRIWQQIFGDGLVRTPEDFGLQGEQPTHPELLDWLAVELHESGWDFKHLVRMMVTSQTFRQSSSWRSEVDDPDNRLWARGPSYRLDAEVIRDMGLWASELLNEKMGGPGIKPYQPDGMWKALAHPASNTKQYQRDRGDKLYRRSLYIFWKRTSPHPMMSLFDAPDRESSCVRRSRTSTALQSLALFNETQRVEMARKLAERLIRAAKDDDDRVRELFSLLTSRDPEPAEQEACRQLLAAARERYETSKDDATALMQTGDIARDEKIDAVECAVWTQVAMTVMASDAVLFLY